MSVQILSRTFFRYRNFSFSFYLILLLFFAAARYFTASSMEGKTCAAVDSLMVEEVIEEYLGYPQRNRNR